MDAQVNDKSCMTKPTEIFLSFSLSYAHAHLHTTNPAFPRSSMQSSPFGFSLTTRQAEEKNDPNDLQRLGRAGKSKVNNKSKLAKGTRIHPSFMSFIHCCMYSSDMKQMRRAKLQLLWQRLCPLVAKHFQSTWKERPATLESLLERHRKTQACLLQFLTALSLSWHRVHAVVRISSRKQSWFMIK